MVPSTPAEFTPVAAAQTSMRGVLQLSAPVEIHLVTGYTRVLAAHSRWRMVGRLPQGEVYRPLDSVFSIEGRQVHEANLVVDDRLALVGFYLPAEARYSPLGTTIQLPPGAFQ